MSGPAKLVTKRNAASSTIKNAKSKHKLTDAERHKRFVEMAKQVGASDNPKDFDKAFKKVASPKVSKVKG
jgi:hypothetical protein